MQKPFEIWNSVSVSKGLLVLVSLKKEAVFSPCNETSVTKEQDFNPQ